MNVAVAVQMIAGIAWVLFIVSILLVVARASRRQSTKGIMTAMVVTGVLAILLSSLSAGLVFIRPEERGVVISAVEAKGYREQALEPGLRWIVPFFENVILYPISRQTYTMSIAPNEGQTQGDDSITARTADGQEIFVDASVIYAIDPTQVTKVHIDWQNRYSQELVRPLARGVIRDAVSQYGVEQVVTSKRTELAIKITDAMREKMSDNGLLLVEFVMRNITFSPEYAASVEQKQIAEQLAQQAKFVVEQRRQEAEQARQQAQGLSDAVVIRSRGDADARLIQAEAEAKALELIASALQDNPDLLTYQYITRLAPGIEVMLVPNDTPYLLPLPSLSGTSSVPVPTAEPLPTPVIP